MEKNSTTKQKTFTKEENDYCKCDGCSSVSADTTSSDFGYWDICNNCNKRIEDGFHYYNHYDGEDHDDIYLYC